MRCCCATTMLSLNVPFKSRSSPAFYCPSNLVLPFDLSTTRAAALGRHESIPLLFLPRGCFLLFGRLCQTNNGSESRSFSRQYAHAFPPRHVDNRANSRKQFMPIGHL